MGFLIVKYYCNKFCWIVEKKKNKNNVVTCSEKNLNFYRVLNKIGWMNLNFECENVKKNICSYMKTSNLK